MYLSFRNRYRMNGIKSNNQKSTAQVACCLNFLGLYKSHAEDLHNLGKSRMQPQNTVDLISKIIHKMSREICCMALKAHNSYRLITKFRIAIFKLHILAEPTFSDRCETVKPVRNYHNRERNGMSMRYAEKVKYIFSTIGSERPRDSLRESFSFLRFMHIIKICTVCTCATNSMSFKNH